MPLTVVFRASSKVQMAAMKRGLPRLVFAPLNRPSVAPSARLRIALNLVELERRLPFSHQTRSEQYLADKTILGRNKSQIASSSFSLSSNKGERGRGRPPFLLCRQNPLLLNRELVLVRGQETSPLRSQSGGRKEGGREEGKSKRKSRPPILLAKYLQTSLSPKEEGKSHPPPIQSLP